MPLKRKTTKLARRSFLSRGGGYAYVPQQDRRVVNLASLLELYMSDAVIQRAVHKRATDLVAGGIELEGADEGVKTDVLNWLENTVRYKGVLSNAIRDAFVFGNGFVEKVYTNDDAPSNEPSSGESLIELAPVSPKQITIVEDDDVESDTYGRVVGYHVRPPMPHSTFSLQPILSTPLSKLSMLPEGRVIHPSRIIHIKFSSLSDSNVGMSLLEPAYNILKSKIEADKVLGTIVVRFAKPIVKAIIENGTPEEIRNLGRLLFNMNKRAEDVQYLVTDDAVKELSILGASGQVLNPETYYKVMLDNICIALGIPRPLLIGAEAGSISGCFDSETEVLTDAGWKRYDEITGSEKIATLDKDMKSLIFETPTAFNKYHHVGDMISIKNKSFDMLVTPDHNVPYMVRRDNSNGGEWKFKKARDLQGHEQIGRTAVWNCNHESTFTIPATTDYRGGSGNGRGGGHDTEKIDVPIEAWADFMGYFLSEGCVVNDVGKPQYKIIITQVAEKQKRILNCLDKLPFHYKVYKRNIMLQNKQLWTHLKQFGKSADKYIPSEILNAEPRIIRIFLDAFIFGDGHISKKDGARHYFSISKRLIDNIQEAFLKVGTVGNIHIQKQAGKPVIINDVQTGISRHDIYRIVERQKYFTHTIKRSDIKTVKYNGVVWDFEMPTSHVLFVRRNGKPYVSGNSDLNLISYFQSLQSDQETVLTPVIRDLISSFLETRNEQLDVSVKIKWKQWFTDEIALFKSTFMNTQSAISAYGAGLITKNEARGMINLDNVSDGEQFIEPDKKSVAPKGFGDVASILPADSPKREG